MLENKQTSTPRTADRYFTRIILFLTEWWSTSPQEWWQPGLLRGPPASVTLTSTLHHRWLGPQLSLTMSLSSPSGERNLFVSFQHWGPISCVRTMRSGGWTWAEETKQGGRTGPLPRCHTHAFFNQKSHIPFLMCWMLLASCERGKRVRARKQCLVSVHGTSAHLSLLWT